ncbi:unnamed protein product [Ectocarpus sp. CCAP 1310/34]|nr:unnamed protein product [Ectocarpus sp. CCAP 1310/34]
MTLVCCRAVHTNACASNMGS